jgi:hypothetical protein
MLPCNMTRPSAHFPPTSAFSYTRNSFHINPFHTLAFSQFCIPNISNDFPTLYKNTGGTPPKSEPQAKPTADPTPNPTSPARSARSNAASAHRPTSLHRNHSATVAHHPLSMYIEPRPHLQFSARRLGRFGSALSYERSEITSGIRTLQL